MPPPTYVALEDVGKALGTRTLLDGVTVGVTEGARIGVVGRNGGGKTTLVRVLTGLEDVDSGRVIRLGSVTIGLLTQGDDLDPTATLRDVVVGDRAEHEWAGDSRVRDVMGGLLGGVNADAYEGGLDAVIGTMSGGERRRAALARLLIDDPDLLVLDEPTNHLDVEAVSWLAHHLAPRRGALVAVTHDRWFLDEVATETWEVVDGAVHRYDGGYAAFVLARAERSRQAASSEERRQNLLRKELAWLRRGAPARTSKPKFRIDAANELIADEPPPRDRLALEKFATARLGKQVYDLEDVTVAPAAGAPPVVTGQTWRLGPGDRIGLLGPNGVGKTTLLRLLAAAHDGVLDTEHAPDVRAGTVRVGLTVQVATLTQALAEIDPADRVLESVERQAQYVEVGGRDASSAAWQSRMAAGGAARAVTARSMLEGFGFSGDKLFTRLGDLSGGELRRLQLLRLLVGGPNVLLLDEPTNDLDVEMLTVLEDLLDTWPGTLVVVSHDRYFLERTTDVVYALLGDGAIRMLPNGVDEYLERRARITSSGGTVAASATVAADSAPKRSAGEARELRKELTRIERRTEKLGKEEDRLHALLSDAATSTDHEKVLALDAELRGVVAERETLEERWLEIAADLEQQA
ncbi:ABC-F family ATP-binding cassette domain-containing protein [Longivirga aurantiaca]|uniref:ABC-F family ATP-binding cassette domain-containing protein n=1 Tax=Longivirga aurantiaca TaxID=1837743 RepID=A0ABW1SWH6_9ACTN